jgi:hypothetical protein
VSETIIESFQVKRLEILDEKGNVDESLMPSLSDSDIKRIYEISVLVRTFDLRALNLQRRADSDISACFGPGGVSNRKCHCD